MIKKLLNKFLKHITFKDEREVVEKYLSQSSNTYDLEHRIRELDKNNMFEKFIKQLFYHRSLLFYINVLLMQISNQFHIHSGNI